MTINLITVSPENTILDAFNILKTKRIHHLPVLRGNKLVGIITTYDIFKLEKGPNDYAKIKVADIMTTKIATLEPDDKIMSLVLLLVENLFHAVPIVDKDKNAIGIVTTLDVLDYSLTKEYPKRALYHYN